jgi:molybdopterin molybdotransferase
MTAPPRLTPVDEALAMLLGLLGPVPPRSLPLAAAIGRVLAAPLHAAFPVPPAATATREGWAVAAALTEGAGPYVPVPLPALPWVAAGAPLPPGTDAVLPPFAHDGDMVLDPVAPGEGVTQPGEAAAAGGLLRPAGHLLRPVDLVLAEAGIATAAVRIPRITLHGCDALTALVLAEGAELVAEDADLLLTAGQPAEHLLCPGIAARPGEATAIGIIGGRPALLLPAPAQDRLAAWWLLGRPAVRALAGRTPPPPRKLVLARKVASPVGFTEVVPLGAAPGGMVPLTGALAMAEALLIVPPGLEGYESGAMIEACDL